MMASLTTLKLEPEGEVLYLPDDLEWTDEFNWSPIVTSTDYGNTGSLFIQQNKKLAGRPISLVGKDDMAWISREDAEKIKDMRDTLPATITLTLPGNDGISQRSFNVMLLEFNIESVRGYGSYLAESWFKVRALNFMEI